MKRVSKNESLSLSHSDSLNWIRLFCWTFFYFSELQCFFCSFFPHAARYVCRLLMFTPPPLFLLFSCINGTSLSPALCRLTQMIDSESETNDHWHFTIFTSVWSSCEKEKSASFQPHTRSICYCQLRHQLFYLALKYCLSTIAPKCHDSWFLFMFFVLFCSGFHVSWVLSFPSASLVIASLSAPVPVWLLPFPPVSHLVTECISAPCSCPLCH